MTGLAIGLRLPEYGTTWHELRDGAVHAERLGFASLWLNDHFQTPGRDSRQGAFEAMTGLAGIAEATSTARLGVAVMSASYRRPGVAARMATAVDAISGGRLTLGLGTGSDRAEHRAYGIPFGTAAERTQGLIDALAVMQEMFAHPEGATVDGQIEDAPNLPPPVRPCGPAIWVAAHRKRLLRIAGERADGIVAAFLSPDDLAERLARAERARVDAGRTSPLRCCLYCYVMPLVSGEETDRFLRVEAERLHTTPSALVRWLRTVGIVGSPDELRSSLAEYAAAGATDVVLVPPNGAPRDFADALAESVLTDPADDGASPARRSGPADVAPHHNLAYLLVERHRESGKGEALAVIDDDGEWSFDAMAHAAACAAGALGDNGVRRGERVAVLLRDGRPWLAAVLGAAWLGAVAVPLDPRLSPDRREDVLDDCDPSLVVAGNEDAPSGRRSIPPDSLAAGSPRPLSPVHADDLAYFIYSSGSTGRPKGSMHAHRDMRTSLTTFVPFALGLGPGDRSFAVPRLFTSLGFGNAFFRALGAGATCVLSATIPTVRSALDVVERHGVTLLTGVPTFWSQLARFLDSRGGAERLQSVRLAFSSGDALPDAVREHLREAAGLELIQGLGCSECSNVVVTQKPGESWPAGSLGVAVPGVELMLTDADGSPVEPGEPGRLWIRSDSNTSGYWRRAGLTRDLVHGEWVRMGDMLAESGGVYRHVGRADDLFKVDGRWVSPSEVEATLVAHDDVAEAAAVARPDERGLMRVMAFVVVEGSAEHDGLAGRLRAHVAHAIAPHSAPQVVEVIPELPRLPSGKLDRRSLGALS